MAKKIRSSDIFEGDFLAKEIRQVEQLQKVLGELAKQFKSAATNSKKILSSEKTFGSAEKINKVEKEINQVNKATEANIKLRKEQQRLTEKLNSLQGERAKKIAATRVQIQNTNKELKQNAILNMNVSGEFQRQTTLLTVLRTKFKDLAAQNKGNTTAAKRLLTEITKLDAKLTKINDTTSVGRRRFASLGGSLSSVRAGFIRVAQAAGVTLGVFGAFRLIKGAVSIIQDFEKQNAILAGVLDTTRENITALTDDAIRLGSVTAKTATDVTRLQTAFSRLGFSQQEILDLTEPTIAGSIALNAGLEETAKLVGAVVNTFDDFSTSDAPLILDQLTAATQKSALEFSKLETALPIVSGAANAAGVPFTRLVALLGKLSDSGIDASKSATALRNIFIESASQGLNFEQILDKIKNSQDKLTEANDEFGKRAAVSATVLANNIDAVKELDETLQAAGGTAERVAKEQLNTLDGAIKLLRSAWEGFILELNDGGNLISGPLTSAIRFLTSNLRTILGVIAALVTSFLAFKVAVAATNAIQKANILVTKTWGVVTGIATGKIKLATIAQRAFNIVVKANPIGLLVAALTAAAIAVGLYSDDVEEATEEQAAFNKELEETEKRIVWQAHQEPFAIALLGESLWQENHPQICLMNVSFWPLETVILCLPLLTFRGI